MQAVGVWTAAEKVDADHDSPNGCHRNGEVEFLRALGEAAARCCTAELTDTFTSDDSTELALLEWPDHSRWMPTATGGTKTVCYCFVSTRAGA
jgi:hypothetical protein